jgi:hypothetical protein
MGFIWPAASKISQGCAFGQMNPIQQIGAFARVCAPRLLTGSRHRNWFSHDNLYQEAMNIGDNSLFK